jgi:hypothetical protein
MIMRYNNTVPRHNTVIVGFIPAIHRTTHIISKWITGICFTKPVMTVGNKYCHREWQKNKKPKSVKSFFT